MRSLARFVIRPGQRTKPEIILGFDFSAGFLKRNVIYEIQECLDELIIKEVGPCALWECTGDSWPERLRRLLPYNWGTSLNEIVQYGGRWLLSIAELEQSAQKQKENA